MGTNYYVRTPGCEKNCGHCSESGLIHLGKSSPGWRFLHRADPDWPREEARKRWLALTRLGAIEDEYGVAIPPASLLSVIDGRQHGRSHAAADPEERRAIGAALYDSVKKSDFECEGYDFCDREFS